ncbi:MAG: hypothetical protein QM747_07785 [Nocardioides sp.]
MTRQAAVRLADGTRLDYRVTAGSLPATDAQGTVLGEVSYTAYVAAGPDASRRPVTFAFNGGPGASSVFLHLGLLGPKRVDFAIAGASPSGATPILDNPDTWLSFTDLVFVDPIGTGFSKSLVAADATRKAFYGTAQDAEYLSAFVARWLARSGRTASPKYLVGESYAGIRVPKMAYRLVKTEGVAISGIILISPVLNSVMSASPDISPLPWVARLPSMAATHLERQGKLTEAAMREAETYARGDYLRDLMLGRDDPQAVVRAADSVAAMIGLPAATVRQLGARVNNVVYTRELERPKGMFVSAYDPVVTNFDPYPQSHERQGDDAILQGSLAPLTSAIVHYVTQQIGWKPDDLYRTLNIPINRGWDHGGVAQESVGDLRKAMAMDGRMRLLISHGYTDLRTPYFASKLIFDQLPPMGDAGRARFSVYPGGHMFYARADSRAAYLHEVRRVYGLE